VQFGEAFLFSSSFSLPCQTEEFVKQLADASSVAVSSPPSFFPRSEKVSLKLSLESQAVFRLFFPPLFPPFISLNQIGNEGREPLFKAGSGLFFLLLPLFPLRLGKVDGRRRRSASPGSGRLGKADALFFFSPRQVCGVRYSRSS